jgi:putative sterol carrier protein
VVDGETWKLDLRKGKGILYKKKNGEDVDKVDITLTMNGKTFVSLVNGKLGSQQAFLMRKLKIKGSMALAMKLQPILDAAKPVSKL